MESDPETALSMIATGNTVIEDLPVLIDFLYLITETLSRVSLSLISFVKPFSRNAYKIYLVIYRFFVFLGQLAICLYQSSMLFAVKINITIKLEEKFTALMRLSCLDVQCTFLTLSRTMDISKPFEILNNHEC